MTSIVDTLCNKHKKKLDLDRKRQAQTKAFWKKAVYKESDTEDGRRQRQLISKATWDEIDGTNPTDNITFAALDMRGAETKEPPFVHEPANYEPVDVDGTVTYQEMDRYSNRRLDFSNPSPGAWVALPGGQGFHLKTMANVIVTNYNNGDYSALAATWLRNRQPIDQSGITLQLVKEAKCPYTFTPIWQSSVDDQFVKDLTQALQNCMEPLPYTPEGQEVVDEGPMPRIRLTAVQIQLMEARTNGPPQENTCGQGEDPGDAARTRSDEIALAQARAEAREQAGTRPYIRGCNQNAVVFLQKQAVNLQTSHFSESTTGYADVISADLSYLGTPSAWKIEDNDFVTRMLRLRWQHVVHGGFGEEWMNVRDRIGNDDTISGSASAHLDAYYRLLNGLFFTYMQTQDQIAYGDIVGPRDQPKYDVYVKACQDNVKQLNLAKKVKEISFVYDVYTHARSMALSTIADARTKARDTMAKQVKTEISNAQKQFQDEIKTANNKQSIEDCVTRLKESMETIKNSKSFDWDSTINIDNDELERLKTIGKNAIHDGPKSESIASWERVTSEEGSRWFKSVNDLLQKMPSHRHANTATAKAKLNKLKEWFLPKDEFEKAQENAKKKQWSNNHKTWDDKIEKATAELKKVTDGDVSALAGYKEKLYKRAIKRLNGEIDKVDKKEKDLYDAYTQLFPRTREWRREQMGLVAPSLLLT